MNISSLNKIDIRIKLSTLWIFVMLNYIYCDVLGLMDSGLLNQYISGTVNGIGITENFLFFGAIMMEVPIAMVLLSRILNYKANRWANIGAGTFKTLVMIATMFVGDGPTKYYLFFGIIEIACTIYIVWIAWKWISPQEENS